LRSRIVVLTIIAIPNPLLQNEVASLLLTLDWASMLQDDYDQVMEMQAEALSRLARLNIVQNNPHGAQQLAERCLNLVAHAMEREQSDTGDVVRCMRLLQVLLEGKEFCFLTPLSPYPDTPLVPPEFLPILPPAPPGPGSTVLGEKLSPRVWRWVSVCERYFGEAVCRVVQSEGDSD
jgi:hypothetical protein